MRYSLAVTLISICVTLSGCSQVSEQLADWLRPPSSSEMSGRVKALAEKGEVRAALAKGESFVKGNPPGVEQVHFVLSQIYLETGDAAKALQHMELANSGSAPMVQGERLDARPEGPAPTGSVSAGTGGAEARITPGGGVEARAGGVTARVPD